MDGAPATGKHDGTDVLGARGHGFGCRRDCFSDVTTVFGRRRGKNRRVRHVSSRLRICKNRTSPPPHTHTLFTVADSGYFNRGDEKKLHGKTRGAVSPSSTTQQYCVDDACVSSIYVISIQRIESRFKSHRNNDHDKEKQHCSSKPRTRLSEMRNPTAVKKRPRKGFTLPIPSTHRRNARATPLPPARPWQRRATGTAPLIFHRRVYTRNAA